MAAELLFLPCPAVCVVAVNPPGTKYVYNTDPTLARAENCLEDTYGPGYYKQRACVKVRAQAGLTMQPCGLLMYYRTVLSSRRVGPP